MPLPTIYDTGTASVANGATTVTLVGAVSGAIYAGDLFCDPAQPLVPPQRIATDPVAGVFELAVAWPGTSLTADPYEVRITPDSARVQERTRRLLNEMSVVEANGRGLFYLFSTTTTDADPGAGLLRFNNATIGSATAAYIDNLDANGAAVQAILDTWDDSGASGGRGQLWVRSVADPAVFHSFTVTGSVVDGTGYRKLTLTYIGGSGTLNADDELMVDFVPVGPAGSASNGVDGKFSGTEVIKTAAYTALAADVGKTIILNKATADTLSFDAAATLGSTWMVMVKNIGAGTWVLDPNGAETIDGAATISLAQNESVVVSCNGTALRSLFRSALAFTAASSAGPAQLDLAEDTDNGTNKVSVKAPSAVTSDRAFVLPDADVTLTSFIAALLNSTAVAAAQVAIGVREVLTANRTYYVRSDGNNSNNGLANTSGGAFLTIQKAIDVISGTLDIASFTVTIQVGSGTYAACAVTGPWVGSGNVQLLGDSTTPSNVIISSTSAAAISMSRDARLLLSGFKLTTSGGGGHGIAVSASNLVVNGLMEYGALVFDAFAVSGGSLVNINANYSITGGQRYHWSVGGGQLFCQGRTVTITGTPALSGAFAYTDFSGGIISNACTFSGSATGVRYSATAGGIIQTYGSGATYLPGNSAGSATSPGAYL